MNRFQRRPDRLRNRPDRLSLPVRLLARLRLPARLRRLPERLRRLDERALPAGRPPAAVPTWVRGAVVLASCNGPGIPRKRYCMGSRPACSSHA